MVHVPGNRRRVFYSFPLKDAGPLPPFNERQRLKLLVSEALRAKKGINTPADYAARSLDREARGENDK